MQPVALLLSGGMFLGDLYSRMALGAVRVRPEIKEFKPGTKTVVFKDGSSEEIDIIVWATGYGRGIGESV